MPSTLARSSTLAAVDAAHAAEALQQSRALLRADAGDVFEPAAAGAHPGTARAHAGDREAVRLVADLRHQHQRGRVVAEVHLGAAVGEHQLLQADLAALALLDADDQRQVESQFLEHLARHATWPRPPSTSTRSGSRACTLAFGAVGQLGQLGVAAHQHLAHRGVVVARRDAVDVEAAVLRALHLRGSRTRRTMPAWPRRPCG